MPSIRLSELGLFNINTKLSKDVEELNKGTYAGIILLLVSAGFFNSLPTISCIKYT